MSLFPPPRDFQLKAHEALRDGVRAGHKNQMLMAATGAGKTYLGLRIISEALAKGKRAVFLCDRKTLINQTSETSDAYGMDHGIYQADHWRVNLSKPFQIASSQTIARRGMNWPDADVIVIDEAHSRMKAWTEFIPNCKAHVIGLSATPFSNGLGLLFSNLVNAATMKELTDSGILVPLIPYSGIKIDMAGAETSGGEWTDRASEERGLEIVGDVVSEWLKIAENRKTIVFGSTIKHCEEMCRQFNEVGVLTETFTSDTNDEDRQRMLSEFKKSDSAIRILISVEALAKGFDVPDVSCVADCRPLRKSLSTAIQMWGRGTRSSPGKENCILLDFAGNFIRFLEDFEDVYHNGLSNLDTGEKLDKEIRKDEFEKEKQSCPKCGYSPFFKTCMSCGHEKISRSNIEVFSGEMQMVEFGKGKHKMPKPQAWDEIVCYMKLHAKPSEMPLVNRAIGMYKNIVGTWPTPEMKDRFDHIDGSSGVSEVIFNQIKHKQIAFAKSRR